MLTVPHMARILSDLRSICQRPKKSASSHIESQRLLACQEEPCCLSMPSVFLLWSKNLLADISREARQFFPRLILNSSSQVLRRWPVSFCRLDPSAVEQHISIANTYIRHELLQMCRLLHRGLGNGSYSNCRVVVAAWREFGN